MFVARSVGLWAATAMFLMAMTKPRVSRAGSSSAFAVCSVRIVYFDALSGAHLRTHAAFAHPAGDVDAIRRACPTSTLERSDAGRRARNGGGAAPPPLECVNVRASVLNDRDRLPAAGLRGIDESVDVRG